MRQLALVQAHPGERAAALGLERARLLKEIARRRKELTRAGQKIETTREEIHASVGPLFAPQASAERELHVLFAALLAPGRLPKRQRASVRRVYETLQRSGFIGPNFAEQSAERDEGAERDDGAVGADAFHDDAEDQRHESARKPLDAEKHGALRTLFKRLVVALHPDRALHEEDRVHRTAVMKDITQAYETGDLARMLELGQLLSPDASAGPASSQAPVALHELLERTVSELKRQLRQLLDELRRLRRSEAFRATKDLERVRRVGGDPLATLKADEQAHLDELLAMRDFVTAFHAGRMSLAEFLEGP